MSDTYYRPEDLGKFGEIAEGNSELAKSFFNYYGQVFEGRCTHST